MNNNIIILLANSLTVVKGGGIFVHNSGNMVIFLLSL